MDMFKSTYTVLSNTNLSFIHILLLL
jgi:hypothetical protein